MTINSDVAALQMRIGYTRVITNPDYNGNGVVDAADYVLWRKGGPLLNDPTPADVGPDDYTYWRLRFGASPTVQNIGQAWHAQLDGRRNYRYQVPLRTAGPILGRSGHSSRTSRNC